VRLCGGGSDQPLTAVVSRSHPSPDTEAFLAHMNVVRRIRRGSSLKFCAVAAGEADIYPRPNPTCLWDTAAGAVVAREAGCRVEDMAGDALRHDVSAGIRHNGFVVYSPETCGSRLAELRSAHP